MRRKRSIMIGVISLLFLMGFSWRREDGEMEGVKSGSESGFYLAYKGEQIKPWINGGDAYFFLPSYFDWTQTEWIVSDGELSIGGLRADSGDVSDYFEMEKPYFYTFDGEERREGVLHFLQSANIGTVFIDTDSGTMERIDEDKEYREAGRALVKDENGEIFYQGKLSFIKSRGNSTWCQDKKSYGIRLLTKTDLFGMGEEENWILLCNVLDVSKIQNKLCLDMARAIGLPNSLEGEWIDLYLNGVYHGNYLLCEKIEISEERIDITDLETETKKLNRDLKDSETFDTGRRKGVLAAETPSDFTGGYILEKDEYYDGISGFVTEAGNHFSLKSPQYATEEQIDYIADYVQQIEDMCESEDEELWEYVDKDSFVLRYLLDELVLNSDFGLTSMFFYKNEGDEHLYAGPVWDYDSCLGSRCFLASKMLEAMEIQQYKEVLSLTWYPYLYQNQDFYEEAVKKYQTVVKPYALYLIESGIDSYVETIRQSVRMDKIRWSEQGYDLGYYVDFDNNIRFMKYFLGRRLRFLDQEWLGEDNVYAQQGTNESHEVTFIGKEGMETVIIPDGECIIGTPEYLLQEREWWLNEWNQVPLYSEIPVYEDVIYRAERDL